MAKKKRRVVGKQILHAKDNGEIVVVFYEGTNDMGLVCKNCLQQWKMKIDIFGQNVIGVNASLTEDFKLYE